MIGMRSQTALVLVRHYQGTIHQSLEDVAYLQMLDKSQQLYHHAVFRTIGMDHQSVLDLCQST